jgi:DNA-binding transcriptional LysR family regulator
MEVRDAPTIIGLVAAGCGVSILPSLFSVMGIKGVSFRPLADPDKDTDIVLASREEERNRPAIEFCKIAKQTIENEMHPDASQGISPPRRISARKPPSAS